MPEWTDRDFAADAESRRLCRAGWYDCGGSPAL